MECKENKNSLSQKVKKPNWKLYIAYIGIFDDSQKRILYAIMSGKKIELNHLHRSCIGRSNWTTQSVHPFHIQDTKGNNAPLHCHGNVKKMVELRRRRMGTS